MNSKPFTEVIHIFSFLLDNYYTLIKDEYSCSTIGGCIHKRVSKIGFLVRFLKRSRKEW